MASNPLQNRVKWFNAQGTWESAVSLFEVMLMLMMLMMMMVMITVMMVMMVNVMTVMNDDDATA